jgi:hypothetical protein
MVERRRRRQEKAGWNRQPRVLARVGRRGWTIIVAVMVAFALAVVTGLGDRVADELFGDSSESRLVPRKSTKTVTSYVNPYALGEGDRDYQVVRESSGMCVTSYISRSDTLRCFPRNPKTGTEVLDPCFPRAERALCMSTPWERDLVQVKVTDNLNLDVGQRLVWAALIVDQLQRRHYCVAVGGGTDAHTLYTADGQRLGMRLNYLCSRHKNRLGFSGSLYGPFIEQARSPWWIWFQPAGSIEAEQADVVHAWL